MKRRRRKQAGFSLVEAMITLAIIGVMVMTIVPSLQDQLSDIRQASAADSVLRIAADARWEAMAKGVTYLVRLQQVGSAVGEVRAYRGMGVRCDRVDWNAHIAANPEVDVKHRFRFADANPKVNGADITKDTHGTFVIFLSLSDTVGNAVEELRICYQPNGETYVLIPDAATPNAPMTRQVLPRPLAATISRTEDDVVHGEDRRVLFGRGATPWLN